MAILDAMDFFASNIVLPVNGVLIALLAGWREALDACDLGETPPGAAWRASLRVLIAVLLVWWFCFAPSARFA